RWVDERLDPEKSTVAAAAYFRDLYAQFGSWPLAQAAYNAGGGSMNRAVRRAGTSDFWVINRTRFLRQETKEFVPAIQAATLIGRNPEEYGFETGESTGPDHERVSVPPSRDVRRRAVVAGGRFERLRALGRVLVRWVSLVGSVWERRRAAG